MKSIWFAYQSQNPLRPQIPSASREMNLWHVWRHVFLDLKTQDGELQHAHLWQLPLRNFLCISHALITFCNHWVDGIATLHGVLLAKWQTRWINRPENLLSPHKSTPSWDIPAEGRLLTGIGTKSGSFGSNSYMAKSKSTSNRRRLAEYTGNCGWGIIWFPFFFRFVQMATLSKFVEVVSLNTLWWQVIKRRGLMAKPEPVTSRSRDWVPPWICDLMALAVALVAVSRNTKKMLPVQSCGATGWTAEMLSTKWCAIPSTHNVVKTVPRGTSKLHLSQCLSTDIYGDAKLGRVETVWDAVYGE